MNNLAARMCRPFYSKSIIMKHSNVDFKKHRANKVKIAAISMETMHHCHLNNKK